MQLIIRKKIQIGSKDIELIYKQEIINVPRFLTRLLRSKKLCSNRYHDSNKICMQIA